jgi:hypothetical protein
MHHTCRDRFCCKPRVEADVRQCLVNGALVAAVPPPVFHRPGRAHSPPRWGRIGPASSEDRNGGSNHSGPDEIQHVLAGPLLKQRQFLNVIKHLGNELRIPVVAAGTQDAANTDSTRPSGDREKPGAGSCRSALCMARSDRREANVRVGHRRLETAPEPRPDGTSSGKPERAIMRRSCDSRRRDRTRPSATSSATWKRRHGRRVRSCVRSPRSWPLRSAGG